MSTTNPATSITAPVVNRTPWQRWRDFWFHPSDPTTLGFIRITTGLLVLYIHLTYSLDLQGFFGPHGWYAGRFIERERLESPSFVQPLNDRWEDPPPVYAQLSEYPHRRSALMQYLRSLPADPVARSRDLAFLNRVSGFQEPLQTHAALEYILRIGARIGPGSVHHRAERRDGPGRSGAGTARLWPGSAQGTTRSDKDLSGHDAGIFPGVAQ